MLRIDAASIFARARAQPINHAVVYIGKMQFNWASLASAASIRRLSSIRYRGKQ